MKKHLISAFLLLSASYLLITGVSAGAENQRKQPETTNPVVSEYVNYTLKDYNGRIALFRGQDTSPEEIYDIRTDSLPGADVERIRHGITVLTEEELLSVLEDYIS